MESTTAVDTVLMLAGEVEMRDEILLRLGMTPYRILSASFEGSGDEGYLEECTLMSRRPDGELVAEQDLKSQNGNKNLDRLYELVDLYVFDIDGAGQHWDWNNDGGGGSVVFDLDAENDEGKGDQRIACLTYYWETTQSEEELNYL